MNITIDILEHFKRFSPIDTAVYRVKDGALETLFLSENIPELLGMTREEYLKITEKDAMDLTLPQDREGLSKATVESIVSGNKLDYYYRVFSNTKGFDWVHVDAHVCGDMDGDTLIIARFANISKEGGIFETILNNSDRLTIVVDRNTYEVLYANDKARERRDFDVSDILDMKCYSLLRGNDKPCEDCMEMSYDDDEMHNKYVFNESTESWSLVTWKRVIWCRRDALIIYIKDVTEERNNKISLDRMNQMYESAVEDAKEMLWMYDPQARTVTYQVANPYTRMICDKIGMPEVIGNVPESIIGLVDDEFKDDFVKLFNLQEFGMQQEAFEYSSTVNGETNWWRVSSRPIYDLNNELKTIFCSGINITEEKQAESNYRSALSQLADIKTVGIAGFRLNLTQNKCVSGNSIYSGLYEQLKTETADEHFKIAVDQIEDEKIREDLRRQYTSKELIGKYNKGIRQLASEYPVRSQLGMEKGQIRWVKTVNYLIANPDTGDIEDMTVVTDITRQKRIEKILSVMANRGCDYIGTINVNTEAIEIFDGIWDCDVIKNAGAIDYSIALDKLTGYHIAGGDRAAFADQASIGSLKKKLESEDEVLIHYDFIDDNQNKLKKQIKCKWLDKDESEILVVQDDITEAYIQEQKRMDELQNALHQAEIANNAKTEFVSRISHDIRTPISAIISMTEFAKVDIDDKAKLLEDIETISDSNKFLLSLINDVLDISKIDSGKIELYPEPYPFDEYIIKIQSVFEPLCIEKQLKFNIDVERDERAVALVDKVRFDQITMNLISNAIKYTPPGGTVTYTSNSKILPNGNVLGCFTIGDTGIGMSEEFQKTMFDAFSQESSEYSNHEVGTGLGLAIVKKIVDLMGGTIDVKSQLDVGTEITVSIELPLATKEQLNAIESQADDDWSALEETLAGKVLLAEDNEINTEIALRLLHQFGLQVDTVGDGEQALEKFKESALGEYQIILMDIQMPKMNGYKATEQIRKLDRGDAATVPIIAMTADAFAESVKRSREAGMNAHITKPINIKELRHTLVKYISG